MKKLTDEQARVVVALINVVGELGAWSRVETTMRDDYNIRDPDQVIDEILKLLE